MIEIKNVSKWYGPVQVLNDCSVKIDKGDVVVVCGPSGSGKSTLIKTVNALEPFQKGEIFVNGVALHDPKTDLPKLRSRVGMVFQHFELFPHLSVTENLTIAQIKVLGRTPEEAKARGLKMLDRVGLMAHKDKFPGQLSGGQQQRVAIARALSMDPIVMPSFEKMVIKELFISQSGIQAEALRQIHKRIQDLEPIAEKHYYHPSQKGHWSIKDVLPALCPDLNYHELDGVQDGGMAMTAYLEAIAPETSPERKAQIEAELLEYCHLDTYAMVRLWAAFSGSTLKL